MSPSSAVAGSAPMSTGTRGFWATRDGGRTGSGRLTEPACIGLHGAAGNSLRRAAGRHVCGGRRWRRRLGGRAPYEHGEGDRSDACSCATRPASNQNPRRNRMMHAHFPHDCFSLGIETASPRHRQASRPQHSRGMVRPHARTAARACGHARYMACAATLLLR